MIEQPPRIAIFGATSAIAEACARSWAMRGARLLLVGRRVDLLAVLAADLRIRGASKVAVQVTDLADTAGHPELLAAIAKELGPPDVALLAWGTLTDQARAEVDPAYVVRELTTNFVAPTSLLLALAQLMAVRGQGVIACITSVAGERGRQSNFVYGAAKGGLQRFLEGLRHRLHGTGVTVLDIRPGFVRTPMTAHLPREGFLWAEPTLIAGEIVRAVDHRRAILRTPWFWRWVMLAVTSLPRGLLHRTRL